MLTLTGKPLSQNREARQASTSQADLGTQQQHLLTPQMIILRALLKKKKKNCFIPRSSFPFSISLFPPSTPSSWMINPDNIFVLFFSHYLTSNSRLSPRALSRARMLEPHWLGLPLALSLTCCVAWAFLNSAFPTCKMGVLVAPLH